MQEEWRNIGQHELFVRMGMNTGMAVVGNMGSKMRMDYTAMGDSVNLASRLEGANKAYGTTAMISENTYNAVKDHVETRRLDVIRVVGKTEPIGIFELVGIKGSLPQKVYDAFEHIIRGWIILKRDSGRGRCQPSRMLSEFSLMTALQRHTLTGARSS